MNARKSKARSRALSVASGIAPLAVVFIGWEILAREVSIVALFVPPPSVDFEFFVKGFLDGTLSTGILLTLGQAFYSFALAALTAIPFGLLLGWSKRLYTAFEPIIEALRPIPSIAMIAPAIIFFGLGDTTIEFVVFYALFWLMTINSLYGIYGVDKVAMMAFQSLRATQSQIFRKLLLPSALPFIFSGLRQSIAVALIVSVAGEMIVGGRGIGYVLLDAERTFDYGTIYAAIFTLSIVGYILNKSSLRIEKRVLRWTKESGTVS